MKIIFLSFLQKRYITVPNTLFGAVLQLVLKLWHVFKATTIPRSNFSPLHVPLPTSRDLGEKGRPILEVKWSKLHPVAVRKLWHADVKPLVWGTNIQIITSSLLKFYLLNKSVPFFFTLGRGRGCVYLSKSTVTTNKVLLAKHKLFKEQLTKYSMEQTHRLPENFKNCLSLCC